MMAAKYPQGAVRDPHKLAAKHLPEENQGQWWQSICQRAKHLVGRTIAKTHKAHRGMTQSRPNERSQAKRRCGCTTTTPSRRRVVFIEATIVGRSGTQWLPFGLRSTSKPTAKWKFRWRLQRGRWCRLLCCHRPVANFGRGFDRISNHPRTRPLDNLHGHLDNCSSTKLLISCFQAGLVRFNLIAVLGHQDSDIES